MRNRTMLWKAAAGLAAAIVVGACSSVPHLRTITLTFVREGESPNTLPDAFVDTDVPGPSLTEEGRRQAQQAAPQLARNNYDAIYSSGEIRSQQTAAPLSEDLRKQVEILSGLNLFPAGWFEGTPRPMEPSTFLLAPKDWLAGDRQDGIPGSINGNQFNDRFTAAVQKIYDSGHTKPIAFAPGGAFMFWTLMNVKNPEDSLLDSHPMPYLGRVVITGNPATGWTLVDWDGIRQFN
jgi:broad specificity phosphatase PhoE